VFKLCSLILIYNLIFCCFFIGDRFIKINYDKIEDGMSFYPFLSLFRFETYIYHHSLVLMRIDKKKVLLIMKTSYTISNDFFFYEC